MVAVGFGADHHGFDFGVGPDFGGVLDDLGVQFAGAGEPIRVVAKRGERLVEHADALERRHQGHLRINRLARRPGNDTNYRAKSEEALRHEADASVLIGSADEIIAGIAALRRGGVEYVIINFGGSRENIRRFAREVMPVFADAPVAAAAK